MCERAERTYGEHGVPHLGDLSLHNLGVVPLQLASQLLDLPLLALEKSRLGHNLRHEQHGYVDVYRSKTQCGKKKDCAKTCVPKKSNLLRET